MNFSIILLLPPNEKSALQQRVTHSGFNAFRPDKYSKFMGIINNKFAFLDKIYSKFNEEIQFRSENKERNFDRNFPILFIR